MNETVGSFSRETVAMLAQVGGIFSLLIFMHFVFDWVYQSHREAMLKAKDENTRFWHCIKYTLPFMLVFAFVFHMSFMSVWMNGMILFVTHYVIDSYVPVMLWAKYLRKAPQFSHGDDYQKGWADKKVEKHKKTDFEAFKEFTSTPLGLVLMITMDQLMHIACLLPTAFWIVLSPQFP